MQMIDWESSNVLGQGERENSFWVLDYQRKFLNLLGFSIDGAEIEKEKISLLMTSFFISQPQPV
jgi:hypothetical protein